jgi:hypothetical protein
MKTEQERLLADLARGGIDAPQEIVNIFEAARAAEQRISAEPLLPRAKADRVEAVRTETLAKATAAFEQVLEHDTRRFDQEEGALRARARGDISSRSDLTAAERDAEERRRHRALHLLGATQNRTLVLQALTDPAAIVAAFDETALTGDVDAMRTVGTVALSRLEALAKTEREEHKLLRKAEPTGDNSKTQAAMFAFERTFTAWRREHPTPYEQLQQLQRRRDQELQKRRYSFDTILRVYKYKGETAGNMTFGTAWDAKLPAAQQ